MLREEKRVNMLEAIIITTGKRDNTKEILRLNDQELYENIKLFNLKNLTGLDRIISMVPIIDLFGKMLTNKILIRVVRIATII